MESKNLIRRCKLKDARGYEAPKLEQLISTHMTEEMMSKFNTSKLKRDRLKKLQLDYAKRTKMNVLRHELPPLHSEIPFRYPVHKKIHDHAFRCHVTEMSRFQEAKILERLRVKHLESKFPEVIKEALIEERERFAKITHDVGAHMLVQPLNESLRCITKEYKFLGKTPRYDVFLYSRKEIRKKWVLHYPLLRRLLKECILLLPKQLVNIATLRNEPQDLAKLDEKFNAFASEAEILLNRFYNKIIAIVHEDKTVLPPNHYDHYLAACNGLVSLYLSKAIEDSLHHVVEITGSEDLVPFLNLTINYQGNLILRPTESELCVIYALFIRKLVDNGRKFVCLQSIKKEGFDNKFTYLNITDELYHDTIKKISKNIHKLYIPILKYVKSLDDQFSEIYADIRGTDVKDDEITFENAIKQILHYKSFIYKASCMTSTEYFAIGQLVLSDYVATMKESLSAVIAILFEKLCVLHINEDESIIQAFEEVKTKALTRPNTTQELIEQGKYMIWVKTVHLAELRTRIEDMLHNLTYLIEFGQVTKEHMELNARTVEWMHNIDDILDQNSTMYEQMKFEAEEKLQDCRLEVEDIIAELVPKMIILDDMDDLLRARDNLNYISQFMVVIRELKKKIEWIHSEERWLGFKETVFFTLAEIELWLYPFYHLLTVCKALNRHINVCLDGQFEFLDYGQTEMFIEDITKEIQKIQKTYRLRLKQAQNAQPIIKFAGLVDSPDFENLPTPLKLTTQALQAIKDFRPAMTMMRIMCNDALMERHWIEMSEIAGFSLVPNAGTTVRKMMGMGLESDMDKYDIISSAATKERELLRNLQKMKAEWLDIFFKTGQFKDTGITILMSLDDIQVVLDDHILRTLTMRGSIFVKPYEAEVKAFYERITRINKTLDEWGKVQSQWLYLLPIFSSKDIVMQMPEEGNLFKEVNDTYRKYIDVVVRDPRVFEVAGATGVLETMIHCNELLEQINEGVTNYLERKRLFFPRFFFLSNDEMLEILSETKDPLRVQPHLTKCFEAIAKLQFDEKFFVHAMFSSEEEKINFKNLVNVKEAGGSVEKWLIQVEDQMVVSVRDQILKSFKHFFLISRPQWALKWPGQVVLCVSQMHWTADVHKALNREQGFSLASLVEKCTEQIADIVALMRIPNLSNQARITIGALITIDVHAKDVVIDLRDNNVTNDREFKWLAQLRYYLENDNALVRLINAEVHYAYEYLGNTARLVITPLTDRCYRTLIGAYHLHLNGAPEGPAGTGKTETVKDLAKAIAVQCVVFNCSDGLDYKAMGKFFKGLASCGAWACFDEFNRIDIEVLSVVAQQILLIIIAVRANLKKFNFEGTEISLNPEVYVCITMNPGYAGRTELPDNLKVLFRTVAMMVPDYAMIGEIVLYSSGFNDARNLSVKIVTVYRLCSEQLSSQNHYDYGMRAVKSVLSAAGNNKRKAPDENENILLLRAILDVNLPKFLHQDLGLFDGIIHDLFPGVVLPEADYTVLKDAMLRCIEKHELQLVDAFILKVIQTYEMMIVRWGFMIVGGPYAGKTSTLRVLADTLSLMNTEGHGESQVQYQTLNPKSITMGQLYGMFDPISYEWNDGVAAVIFRNFTLDLSPDRKWIIFDGPVDAVWIENMNSVLDDNRKLCLMSGEVMTLTSTMSLIFEVQDLEQASPATVSRCGMVYMEPKTLGWRPLFQSWLAKQNPVWAGGYNKEVINAYFEWLVPPSLYFIKKNCIQFCKPGDISLVKNMMDMLQMYLDDAVSQKKKPKKGDETDVSSWMVGAVIQAGIWGVASILDSNSREKFDEFWRTLWKDENPDYPIPKILTRYEITLPGDGLIFDYDFVFKGRGGWKSWPDSVKNEKVEECKNITQALIPTVDTARYQKLIHMHIRHKRRILLMGPTGTGKSYYIQDLLMNKLDIDVFEPSFITFTVQITANQAQELIISKLFKRRRGNYGASKGKTAVLFIDDVNMPLKEQYGAQPPLELLRQFFDHKTWYDLKVTTPIYLHDVLFIGAMGLVGGSRQDVYARFLRHFSIFSINEFSQDSMAKIYTNILHLGWKNNGFPSEIYMVVLQLVNASLAIYKWAIENLRPTPSKSHYVFNLRDFSRLILGCAMIRKESAEEKTIFPRVWVHEVFRIFHDRLIEEKDKELLFQSIKICVRDNFKEFFDKIMDHLPREEDGSITLNSMRSLLFGSYFDQESDEDRRYEEISSIEAFRNLSQEILEDYNVSHKTKMDIVLFDYALEHLSRICRMVTMKCGSGLLVGISGSGRQSLARLTAAIYNINIFQPEITNNYNLNDWRDDIKKIVKEAGGRGKDCIFLIAEGQIKLEEFLQDVDCLLNSGEVPNIYQIDEKQEILDMVRLAAQGGNRNLDISPLSVFFFFTKRCMEKLHILLCFSPVGNTFRNRLRLYPSLINCCTINWFDEWPESALEEVALNWMEDVNLEDEIKMKSVIACKHFHVTTRQASEEFFRKFNRKTYTTSASYLELIRNFTELTNKKQTELMTAKNRYLGGLLKLDESSKRIAGMQAELGIMQPILKQKTEEATALTLKIDAEKIQLEEATQRVNHDEQIANKQAAAAQAIKLECEKDLAEAMPMLNEALSALDTLKPVDIIFIKTMKNPPFLIKLVMAAVCVLKGVKPDKIQDYTTGTTSYDYWGPSKKVLGDMNFLQSLKDYDKDHIPPQVIAQLRRDYISHKDFKPHIVQRASIAAEGLCKWVIAMDMYEKVYRVVGPKKAALAAAEAEFEATMKLLNEKRAMRDQLERELAEKIKILEECKAEQAKLEGEVANTNTKIFRAQKMIGGLGGERTNWTNTANNLQSQYDHLAGDILISCGIICYMSPYNNQFRQRLVSDWHRVVLELKIPCDVEYNLVKILGSDVKIQNWNITGLPRDDFSTENAIIQDNSRRWSLLIDPQSQANNWIKKMEKDNNLEVVKFSFSDYMKRIERCVQLGYPVLVESIEEDLEAPLDALLFKKIFRQAGIDVIALGENVIEYNRNFKLYLTSKLRNPHYLPEVFNKVTIINFALTIEGLRDQLLGIVVAVEKPELQQLKEELIIQKAENKAAKENTEELILKTLSEAEGDILEDENACTILDTSKQLAIDIEEKQKKSLEIEASIEEFRVKYKSVSDHSAILYYSISDLANVDPMYQYSLEWFINLYIISITKAEKFRSLEKRCISLINAFTYDLYRNTTRSLFEKDKLLFAFLLCCKILIHKEQLEENEFFFLLTGGINVENPRPNTISWLPSTAWNEMCRAEDLSAFRGFAKSFQEYEHQWKDLYDNFDEKKPYPGQWNDLSPFRKLIVIRILRCDQLIGALYSFVKLEMDERFIRPPPFDISVSYNDSFNLCPLIFILSPGTDPMSALMKFCNEMKYHDKFDSISLGQGQGPRAQKMIEEAADIGNWVCLQNCHLATSWMPSLEKIFDRLDPLTTHPNFRLWLTSYPSPKFPVSILQKGIKMTNEPPTGLQNNLLKSYVNNPVKDPNFYDGCPDHPEMFARLLYGLAFFHAVVQERRTFGALGWNIPYGFNDSDFDISVQQLQMFINESENPYEAITYLIGECNYGGRVTDDWDRRLIVTLLDDYINPRIPANKNYTFSTAGKVYGLPDQYDYASYVNHIQKLPTSHPPEVFGLHTNAGITRDLKNSKFLLENILKAYGETTGGAVMETDKFVMVLCSDILSKLPNEFDLEKAQKKYPVEYSESMNTVLVQEMERFNKLLRTIQSTLVTMQRAIQGLVAMSPEIEAFSTSLFLARVPASWARVSYPTLKNLPNYVTDFIQRLDFLQLWYEQGKPINYWISGFFFTQAFLTGVKQNFARRYTIAIDKLTFDFKVMKVDRMQEAPNDGAYIYGLYTDGARWDVKTGILQELYPKILNDYMPIICIIPIEEVKYQENNRYRCPVYKTSERRGVLSTTGHSTNYVVYVLLNTNKGTAHWIKRSVALLCQPD